MDWLFETIMLICFGASWPLAVHKTWTTRDSSGKSLAFLSLILVGYLAGICHKILNDFDPVTYLYAFNALFVAVDLTLSIVFRPKAKVAL